MLQGPSVHAGRSNCVTKPWEDFSQSQTRCLSVEPAKKGAGSVDQAQLSEYKVKKENIEVGLEGTQRPTRKGFTCA